MAEMQALIDAIENKGRYLWLTFNEERAQNLGFENRKALTKAALGNEELEVNEFYCGVRFKPTSRVRNVEVGRVAVVTYGPHYGKQAVITDVVDQARVVVMGVDGMLSDLAPQSFPIKRLHLTACRIPKLSQRGHRVKKVKSLLTASLEEVKKQILMDNVVKQVGKRSLKKSMTDFDRFKAFAEKRSMFA